MDLFEHPFEAALHPQNRWVVLASLIPWDGLAEIYSMSLNENYGRKSVDVRVVIAAIIIKHKLNLDDRAVIVFTCNIFFVLSRLALSLLFILVYLLILEND